MANFNKDIPDLPENTGGASLDGSELFEIKKGTGLGSSQKLTLNNLASKIKDIIASFFATAAQGAKADTAVQSIVAGTNISIDNTDPHNPKITGSGGTVKTVNTVNPDGSGNVPIAAANVPFTPPTGMTSTDVQAAVAEAYNHGGGGGGGTAAVFTGARAYNDGSQSIPANISTAVTFNTNIYDTSAVHSTTTNTSRFTVPANLGGRWRISFKVKFSATGGIAFIRKNGGTDTNNIIGSTVTGATALANTVTANLVAGDYIELFAYNPSAVTIGNTYATDQGSVTALEMQYVEGGGANTVFSAAWTNLALQNSWVNYGTDANGTWQGGQYVKDAFGIVHLHGIIKNGAISYGTIIATLPTGYAPPTQVTVGVNVGGTGSGTLIIDTSGNVKIGNISSSLYIVLDNVQWSTNTNLTSIAGGASSGTYASAPTSPAYVGQVYQCTDCPLTMIGIASGWSYFHRGEAITLPTALSTWVNQGTATETDVGPFKTINAPALAGDNQRILAKTLANASNYTVTAKLSLLASAGQYAQGGLILRNSTSGAAVTIHFSGQSNTSTTVGQQLAVAKWNSPSSYNAAYYGQACANPGIVWMRFVDDGTNRKAYISFDGVGWLLLTSSLRTDFVTPNQVGFYVSSSGGSPAIVTCLSFQETTP